jgi:uncharacterized protein YlzI (FlbEa/FlbD family)
MYVDTERIIAVESLSANWTATTRITLDNGKCFYVSNPVSEIMEYIYIYIYILDGE